MSKAVKEAEIKRDGQPIVSNPTEAAFEALVGGRDLDEAVYGTPSEPSGTYQEEEGPEISETSALEDLANNLNEGDIVEHTDSTGDEESSELSDESPLDSVQVGDSQETEISQDYEEITVRGPDGRKQKLKIDYSDREAIKKFAAKAAGMRKFQAERDEARKKLKEIESQYTDTSEVFGKLEKAWEAEGVKGVVSLLGQSPEAWQKAVDEELANREYLKSLSPEERYKHDLEIERQAAAQEKTELEKRYESLLEQNKQAEESAQLRSLESKLHPAFDRYRFSGKLGDAVAEQHFDQAVWDQVTKRLGEYPDDIELTKSVIDREFRTVANNFRKLIKGQSEKKVNNIIAKKKNEAAQRVQTVAKKGVRKSSATQDFVDKMRSGDIQGSFLDVFTGKVKL